MTLRTPSPSRSLPVRLCDLPLAVRAHAAQVAAKTCDEPMRYALLDAALNPSDQTYYVHPDAAILLEAWKAA